MNENWLRLRMVIAAIAFVAGVHVCCAAPDDTETLPNTDPNVNAGFFIDDSNFDQWIFQGVGNAEQGFKRLESSLKLKLDELKRVCGLEAAQERKLRLAASGDIKRFMDEVEVVRVKFKAAQRDQNKFNQIWQEISPLQQKLAKGLFNDGSLFTKALRKTLTSQQLTSFDELLAQRKAYAFRAIIECTLTSQFASLGLNDEQHTAFSKLLIEYTTPPADMSNLNLSQHHVTTQLTKIPRAKLTAILNADQLKKLQPHLGKAGGIDAMINPLVGWVGLAVNAEAVHVEAVVEQKMDPAPADATNPENVRPKRRTRDAPKKDEALP